MSPPHIKEAANSKIFELKIKEWAACTPTVHKIKIAYPRLKMIFFYIIFRLLDEEEQMSGKTGQLQLPPSLPATSVN